MPESVTDTMTRADATRGESRLAPWLRELRVLLAIGVPMALTQLIQFSVNAIDVLMIGRLGPAPLAASSLGLVIFFATFMMGFGPAMAVTPLVAQALGADRSAHADVRASVRMSLWAIVFLFPVALLIYACTEPLALALGQPPHLARLAGPYVLALAPGLPFMLGELALRNFLAALHKTRVPLLIIALTTALNALLNQALIYGSWGFPRLELVGAGIASSLSHLAGFVAMALYVQLDREAARFELFKQALRPHWARLKEVARLGWPISVSMAFEGMLFNAAVFLMGRIGVTEVAAYQVAINVAAIAFMIPLGLSMGGAVRVGLAAGAGDTAAARRAAIVTIGVCAAAIFLVAGPVMITPDGVAGLYLDRADPGSTAVAELAAAFLPIAAAFALFDAAQVAANQCLRALKDVRFPMVLTGIAYWVVGFPLAAVLGLFTSIGAVGVWWGLLASLLTAAVLLIGRLHWLLRSELAATPDPSPQRMPSAGIGADRRDRGR